MYGQTERTRYATESRLSTVIQQLEQLAQLTDDNPVSRLETCKARTQPYRCGDSRCEVRRTGRCAKTKP